MPTTQILDCNTSQKFDELLASGVFSSLTTEKQIELYNNSVMAEDLSSNLYHEKIVDYDPNLHAGAVDDLIRRATSSLICGSDIPRLDDLNYSAQVYIIDGKVVGVIAHERHVSNRYISLLAVSEEREGNGIMGEMIKYVAMMEDPLVALVLNSNSDTLNAFESYGFQIGNCYNGYYEVYR